MILLASGTAFGQDVMSLINPLTVLICLGVVLKIIQTLYALSTEDITADKAKTKIKQLFKVAAITVTLSQMSDTIVNGYLLDGISPDAGAAAIAQRAIILLRDLLKVVTGLAVSMTVTLSVFKLLQLQKTEQPEETAELKKQTRRIIISGILISSCLALTVIILSYFGFSL